MNRISIFKKRADNLYLGGFWGDKSRGTKSFSIRVFLVLTGHLVKIGVSYSCILYKLLYYCMTVVLLYEYCIITV